MNKSTKKPTLKKKPVRRAPLVKKRSSKKRGLELFEKVVALTGIPSESIQRELKAILDRKNIDVNSLTLDQLRGVVASYLREIMGGILDRPGHKKPDLPH